MLSLFESFESCSSGEKLLDKRADLSGSGRTAEGDRLADYSDSSP